MQKISFPIIFDGRAFAARRLLTLKVRVEALKKRGVTPKLASILVGEEPASRLYVALKKKRAEEAGIELEVISLSSTTSAREIIQKIKELNGDKSVQGIMVQLPLPKQITNYKLQITNSIKPQKDVDGLRTNSSYVHPTAMAVSQIIAEARKEFSACGPTATICVVGEQGMVGKSLLKELKNSPLRLIKETKEADVVVSATGTAGVIKAGMIKKGAVVIDVGSPKGDVEFAEVSPKASFITPVPGGVGPVTIACLLENLIVSAGKVC